VCSFIRLFETCTGCVSVSACVLPWGQARAWRLPSACLRSAIRRPSGRVASRASVCPPRTSTARSATASVPSTRTRPTIATNPSITRTSGQASPSQPYACAPIAPPSRPPLARLPLPLHRCLCGVDESVRDHEFPWRRGSHRGVALHRRSCPTLNSSGFVKRAISALAVAIPKLLLVLVLLFLLLLPGPLPLSCHCGCRRFKLLR